MNTVLIMQVKAVFVSLIEKTARKNNVNNTDVKLCFRLDGATKFICRYGKEEINVSDAGQMAALYKQRINSTITKMLLNFSDKNNIDTNTVNITMKLNTYKQLILTLMDNDTEVKNITIDELVN